MPSLSPRVAGTLFALTTAAGLGAITTQAKLFYFDGGNALTLMLTRFAVSTLVFGLILALARRRFAVERPLRWPLLLIGLVWSGAMICYLSAVESISVSLAVLILYFYPLLVLLWSILRGALSPSPGLIGLFVGAFAGLYLALSADQFGPLAPTGLVFGALAAFGAAFTFIAGARLATRMSPLLMTFWINLAGLLMILPLMVDRFALPTTGGALTALASATAFYLVAILSQFQALARLPAARAAFLLNLEPVVSILLALLVLNESLSLTQAAGVLLVLGMLLLSLRFRTERT